MRQCEQLHRPIAMWHLEFNASAIRRGRVGGSTMTRAAVFLFMLLLSACSDERPAKEAVNEMIESPLQNTVISSFDTYPPKPVVSADEHERGVIAQADPTVTGSAGPQQAGQDVRQAH